MRSSVRALLTVGVMLVMAPAAAADEIAAADLHIQGVGLKVVTVSATTGLNIPAAIQTEFAGKQNDQAPVVEGLLAVGELTGPGIDTPIRLEAAPGHRFQVPGLSREGVYFLQNIRLMKGGDFLQAATPSIATITVSNVLQTSVRVRQLTPEELRARGISIDARNYDVYEYTFSFFVNGQVVEIPFPVIIDPRTREVLPVPEVDPYQLPGVGQVTPPRWAPPEILTFDLAPPADFPQTTEDPERRTGGGRISIPAALVIPNNLAVLHQFFAVTLMVTNGAPQGSQVVLEDVSAQIKPPAPLRTVKSIPSVAFNQAVPIVDANTGVTFLVAQAEGEAEWTMEGLQPGTHTIEVDVRATYKSPGQNDFPLRGTARASVVVHDPRFNITFSHPDTIRKDFEYTTYSFITNMSPAQQTIRVTNGVPACAVSPGANVCRVDGTPEAHELTIPAGEMRSVEYRLKSGLTGNVFASAGTVSDDAISAAVHLHMGVSESGIPLSPATLLMPYYSRFLAEPMISANLQLLGLGYSLATAPLTPSLAKHPRVIKTDVFHRAVDIARAGQRVFLGEPARDSLAHMALDLLGNANELREWDELRRREKSGRTGSAAIARQLEAALGADTLDTFVSRFASSTAWREPYLLAVSDNAKLAVRDAVTNARMSIAAEAESGWVRQLPFGEINTFRSGELAIVGRWTNRYEISVTPAATGAVTLDVLIPAAANASIIRGRFAFQGTAGETVTLAVERGATSLELRQRDGGIAAVGSLSAVDPQPLAIVGARQDLHLDDGGHKVSVLWNRAVGVAQGDDLLDKFSGQVSLNRDGVSYNGPRPISSAALQSPPRIVNLTFDHALSRNATYTLSVSPLLDPLSGAAVSFAGPITPVIDNDRPGGIIFGHVLQGDNTPIPNAQVQLFLEGDSGPPQYDTSRTGDGAFLFEYVPRDIDNGLPGLYQLQAVTTDLKSTAVDGAVRLPGSVHLVNLVFLGRGSAEGIVRYDNGDVVEGARVTIASTMFDQFRTDITDANGRYSIEDLPVGPLTFSAADEDGNVTFAASEIRSPGQVLVQNLSIFRQPFPGTATIRGIVRRGDTNAPVPLARVGVYSQGYGMLEGFTDSTGQFEFTKVPTGFVTVLAAEWNVSRESAALDFDLSPNEVRDVELTLIVKPNDPIVVVEGDVTREDPLFPGDASKYTKVAGALVKIEGSQVVTADANGHYIFPSVPASFAGKKIEAYDPVTTRTASTVLPQLNTTAPNLVPIFIATANGFGTGTIRVRLLNAAGFPVTGYRVIEPGFAPYGPWEFESKAGGIYERTDIPVGSNTTVWAIGSGAPPYGDQVATGTAKVEFNGHIASLTLRLPGQGTVRTKLTADIDVIGDVKITYPAWEEADQALAPKELTASTNENGVAGYATFPAIPALQNFTVSSQHPVYGYAAQSGKVGFDGDVRSITLQLDKLSTIRGVVYAVDGRTPVPGAAVRLEDGRQDQGIQTTRPDGSFEWRNVPASASFRITAEVEQNGIYRTGVASGNTPSLGGPVEGVAVILRTQGGVDGRVVYAGYEVFDPDNAANNKVDTTPGNLSDNAPVPLAHFTLRELSFPNRDFGSLSDPLTADAAGRFTINNVFTGPLRVTAIDPTNQEIRGVWTGSLSLEGDRVTAIVGIGAEGFGPVTVRVLDPNAENAPVLNAEVTLIRGNAPFDFSSTDGSGTVRFEQVPVGTYKGIAYSKALGRSGSTANFTVATVTGAQVSVILEFSGKVDGRLIDPEDGGDGVPGAPVTLTANNYSTRASTDVEGAFVFDGVREGIFRLEAKDTLTNRRASAQRELTQANPNPFVEMQLEPTETLHVSVYLPNDSGGNSNILAPLVNAEVQQRNGDYRRELQGNAFAFTGVLENERYTVTVDEIGGAARHMAFTANFPKGSAADPLKLVLPAFGSVEVRVTQGGAPAGSARVSVSAGGRIVTVYTDAAGIAVANAIPLGSASVQVVTVDGAFSGSANVNVTSQSIPAIASIALGAYAGVTGLVEAETGGPSVGTRVVASFGSRILEMQTDLAGRYTFQGIPTSTTVNLTYFAPDGVTIGASQPVQIGANDASRIIPANTVRLDATQPQVTAIFPADGTANVSPDSSIRVTFSEPIGLGYLTTTYFQLVPADTAATVNTTFTHATNADGTFTVTMRPPSPPAGQNFPLKSNTLYRVIISGEISDLTGNKLPAARGASFITSDYTEPRVLKVIPSPLTALQPATTFEFRFNEPIDPSSWQPGGGGVFQFWKVTAADASGAIIAEKSGRAFLDPSSPVALFFTPNDPIEQESFYRITFSGVRDLQANLLAPQTFHFFSYDLVKPFVTFQSPVPEGYPLISGVEYLLSVDVRNGSANGTPASDVSKVDFFRVDGGAQTYLFTATKAPFVYRIVAPDAPPAGSTVTFRAIATDHSLNESEPATASWQVKPNEAPKNVVVTMTPPASVYPGNRATAAVTFNDEGVFATVRVVASAVHANGTAYSTSQIKQLTRAKVDDRWPDAIFQFDLPGTLAQGTKATFTATVTDVRGLEGTGEAQLDVAADAIAPEIVSLTPFPQTRFNIAQKYQISAVVRDLESGAAEVTFSFDNKTITVPRTDARVTPAGDRTWLFSSGEITVPAKNVDTTVAITVTAKDYGNNVISRSTEVIYIGVNDPSVPRGAFLCPIDGAVYPAGASGSLKLQISATDDIAVTAVKFNVPGIAEPVPATRVGTSSVYEATVTVTLPAAGQSLEVRATISDANPDHDVEVSASIKSVAIDLTIDDRTEAIHAGNVATYNGKSVLVRGASGRLVPHVPLTLANLIVLDGARVETLFTTTTVEQKLDLTVTGHLFIDCASSIDVTARGYLGGWGANADGSGTRNDDPRGRTVGNTVTGGATTFSSASHGGVGGQDGTGVTNAVYGSITAPTELGAGGGGATNGTAGASGGGAVKLRGGVIAVAGSIRADGGSRIGSAHAGAGGSINIDGAQFIAGPAARITANGGDDDDVNNASRGGGGGRIAIRASERFDVENTGLQIQAHGGRNSTPTESASYVDGGAGTVFMRRPGQQLGELHVSSFDDRVPLSIHRTRPTPLDGDLRFERVVVGQRALVRADAPIEIDGVVNDKTKATIDLTGVLLLASEVPALQLTTTPAAGSTLIQGSTLSIGYTATSAAGIASVSLAFSPVTPNRVDSFFSYPISASPTPAVSLTVPSDAALAPATLQVTATDRAGRTVTSQLLEYSVVANAPPAVTQLDVAPAAVYPGQTVQITTTATDDLRVTKLVVTRTLDSGGATTSTFTPNTTTAVQTVNHTVPNTTAGGQNLTVAVSAEDAFPGRAATTLSKVVTILADTVAPTVTIVSPATDTLFKEGSGTMIQVRASIADAEVGVKEAFVTVEGSAPVAMTKSGNEYVASVPVPPVDGTAIITRTVTVLGRDYAGNPGTAAVTIRVEPLNNPDAPVVTWSCPSTGALLPAGINVRLLIHALGNDKGNAANGVQKVEFFAADSTTPIVGAAVSGQPNYFDATYAIPAATPAGTVIPVRAVVTNVSGLSESVLTSFTIIVPDRTISADTTISATDTSYDNLVVAVSGGTTTILGEHTFKRLIVISGAKVTHPIATNTTINRLSISATDGIYVSCNSAIDVTGRGLNGAASGFGRTWPNTTTGGSYNGAGGSHGGRGGAHEQLGDSADTYGSPMYPDTPGGAGGYWQNGTCSGCNAGGGIVRIVTRDLVVDGDVLSNGAATGTGTGAGGSIWIDAESLSGGGEIRANGAAPHHAGGGGGRVAIYYRSLTMNLTRITASGGAYSNNPTRTGAAGTVYLRQVDQAAKKVADQLVVDNAADGRYTTPLTTIGPGTVTAVNGAVVTLSTAVPEWIEGAWIAFLDANGTVLSRYEIAARSATSVTVRLADGEAAPSVTAGNAFRGFWLFDRVVGRNRGELNVRDLDTTSIETPATSEIRVGDLRGQDVTIRGRVDVNLLLKARNLLLESGAFLSHSPTITTEVRRLTVDVAETMTIDETSVVDVSGRGLSGATSGFGYTWPNTTTGGSYNGAGGSHGGRGGAHETLGDSAAAYGSLYDPDTPGGAGGYWQNGTCTACNAGGGIARLRASTLVLHGKVLSNGVTSGTGTGAGGSVRIDAQTITGGGEIHADGAAPHHAAGGGGRVAIYYGTLGLDRSRITAAGGLYQNNPVRTGSAGTVYFRQNGSTGAKIADEIVVDNLGRNARRETGIPSIGEGTVVGVGGAIVTLSNAVPEWIVGSWIEFLDATGATISSYEIVGRTSTTVTVRLASNEAAPNVTVGNQYRGTWRFDQVTARGTATIDTGDVESPLMTTDATGVIRFTGLNAGDLVLRGRVEVNGTVRARNLSLQNGAVLTHSMATDTVINRLVVDVAETLQIDSLSAIDVTGRGLNGATGGRGRTWPNTTTGGSHNGAGGSHGGRGGAHETLGDSAATYGSLYDPDTPGGAGGYWQNGTCSACNAGGGIARVRARDVIVHGRIVSNGQHSTTGTGAGGSIRIDAATIAGAGEIRADGSAPHHAAGGGGRIAIYYGTLSIDPSRISAAGGLYANNATRTGAAGTVYLHRTGAALGDLLVDNLGRATNRSTTIPGVGYASVSSSGAAFVRDDDATFLGPNHLVGTRLVVDYNRTTTWPITSNSGTELRVDTTANPLTAAAGAPLRGLHRFATLKLRNARLDIIDLLDVTGFTDKDAASVILGNNQGPPVVNASLISVGATATGAGVLGTAGAIIDLDPPVTAFATNTTTGNVTQATVASDGSVQVAVQGTSGDVITLKVRDGNHYPLESPVITAGTLGAETPIPGQINKSDWTSDANFHVRRLSRDGIHLALTSHPATTSSDRMVLMNVIDKARPHFVRTLTTGAGAIRDVVVSDGWAYVAANRFFTLDLNNPAATPLFTGDPCGTDRDIVLSGGYAFTAMADCFGDPHVNVYDVSTPSLPRHVGTYSLGPSGINYTELLALGTDYIVGISPNVTGGVGHDVMVIDRRKVTALRTVADFDIPNFIAFRGDLVGTKLYLSSTTPGQFAVVDLSNPLQPVTLGVTALPAVGNGVTALGTDVFVPAGAGGLVAVDVASQAAPVVSGVATIAGVAFDAEVIGEHVYVANEVGLALVAATVAPQIDVRRISMSLTGTMVTITGAPSAIEGRMPISVGVRNDSRGSSISGITVQSDGSFQASLPASAGEAMTLAATDSIGKTNTIPIGKVPFGSTSDFTPITPSMTDANFYSRNVATTGNHVAVASYPEGTSSDKIVLFDVTNRANPQHIRTIGSGSGVIRDLAAVDGFLLIASDRFSTLRLDGTNSAVFTGDPCGSDHAIAVAGGYAFTSMTDCFGDPNINVYDISNPAVPRYLRTTSTGPSGYNYTDVVPFGTDYIVGISPHRPSGAGRDVAIIDRRDITNIRRVAEVDVPNFDGFRGEIVGNTLYVSGTAGGMAVVDLSNPLAPQFVRVVQTPGFPRSIASFGTLLAVGDGSAGATFVDISAATNPVVLGSQVVGSSVWECVFNGTTMYVASEHGLAVIDNLGTPPLIDRSLMIPASNGIGGATVTAGPGAILGIGPLSAQIRNATTGVAANPVAVNANGSFVSSIDAMPGQTLTIQATDALGRTAGPLLLGSVPFGSQSVHITITTTMTDNGFMARTVATAGRHLAVASHPADNSSDKILLFDVTTPGQPVHKRTLPSGTGVIRDLEIEGDWLFIASDRFGTLNLADATSTQNLTGDPCGSDYAIALADGFAFTSMANCFGDANVNIYDVSTPSAPRHIATQSTSPSGYNYTDLVVLDDRHLIAISPNRPSGAGRDLTIIDRTDVHNLRFVSTIDVPNFDGFRAHVVANMVYVAGVSGGVAMVDVSNPLQPILVTVARDAAAARMIDAAGAMLTVANGGNGISFVDVSDPANPRTIGSHATPGSAWDVALSRGAMYVATENGLTAVSNVVLPPMIERPRISLTPAATTTAVSGASDAVSGIGALTVRIRNEATQATSSPVAVSGNGSFSATVTAVPGESLSIIASDAAGRTATRSLGRTFGAVTTYVTNPSTSGDGNFRARRVVADENIAVVTTGHLVGAARTISARMHLFAQPNASATPSIVSASSGNIRDVEIAGGFGFVAADRMSTINLIHPSLPQYLPGDPCGSDGAIAIAGQYAFTAMNDCFGDANIHVYNIANPAAPAFVRSQAIAGTSGINYLRLAAYGSSHLVALSLNKPSSIDRDITILDVTNPNSIVKVAEIPIPNFEPNDAIVHGTTLYVAGYNSVAIFDLTNPAAPLALATFATGGTPRGLAMSGPDELAVATGSGLTFVSVADKTRPVVIGRQVLQGNVVDVAVIGKTIHVAAENFHHRILRP